MFKDHSRLLLVAAITIFSACNDTEPEVIQKKPVTSIELLKKELTKYPDSLFLTEKLIEYYRNQGNYDSAISITDAALKKDPMIPDLWDIIGTLYYENEDTANAIHAFETAINIYQHPDYLLSLGTLYAETKNPRALEIAEALTSNPKDKKEKEAIFIRGLYNSYKGDKKLALKYFDSCLAIDPAYMFAYREKGIALYDLGKYDEAVKVLTKAVTLQNSFDEGYYWLGKCFEKLGNKERAVDSYQHALMYDKDFVEAREALEKLK